MIYWQPFLFYYEKDIKRNQNLIIVNWSVIKRPRDSKYYEYYEWADKYYEWTDEYYEYMNEYYGWTNNTTSTTSNQASTLNDQTSFASATSDKTGFATIIPLN